MNATILLQKAERVIRDAEAAIPDHVKIAVTEHYNKGVTFFENRGAHYDLAKKTVCHAASVAQDKYLVAGDVLAKWMHELPFDEQYLIFTYLAAMAVFVVYVASKAGVCRPSNSGEPDRQSELFHPADLEEIQTETMGDKEAYMMPVMGGIFLCTLYAGIKYFSKETVQWFLTHYMSFAGSMSVGMTISLAYKGYLRLLWNKSVGYYKLTLSSDSEFRGVGSFSKSDVESMVCELEDKRKEKKDEKKKDKKDKKEKKEKKDKSAKSKSKSPEPELSEKSKSPEAEIVLAKADKKSKKHKHHHKSSSLVAKFFPIISTKDQLYAAHFTIVDILCFFISIGCLIGMIKYPCIASNWLVNNFLGISIAITGMTTLKLSTFKSGLIMLAGLFFYDIFFVFGTDVMLTVATNIDGPIKLVVPKNEFGKGALLGLGDIVVPGIYLSLCLRFDVWRAYRNGQPYHLARKLPAPYFVGGLIGYVLALAATMAVLQIFHHGQPALLYICPAISLSTLFVALYNKEVKTMWAYDGEEEIEEVDADTE